MANPAQDDTGLQAGQPRSPTALLVRLQWIAGKRAADTLPAGPFPAVIVLTSRIRWFDMGERTNAARSRHARVAFGHAQLKGEPPASLYA